MGQSFANQAWFQSLEASGGLPVIDDSEGGLHICVAILRNEHFSGALVGILDRPRSERLARDPRLNLTHSGSAAVLSRDRTARLEIGDAAGVAALRASRAAELGLLGRTGRQWVVDSEGRGWLLAYAPIPSVHWALVLREPRDELDDDLTHQLQILLALLVVGAGLALIAGWSVARLITSPLIALSVKAQDIAAGNFGDPRSPSTPDGTARDELQAFSQAFARMEQAIALRDREIREASANLEQKVQERTAELRQTQDALLVSNRFAAMGKTAGALAHEIKNALNGLGVSIDLLTQGQLPKERGDAIRAQVREEIARLRDISDNLNLFGAEPRLALAEADLHVLLNRSLALLAPQIRSGEVDVELELAGGGAPLWLRCDGQKIQTAFLNLCKNALDAMDPSSFGDPLEQAPTRRPRRLRVRTLAGDSTVEVDVEDTGAGLSAEARAHLFEPFFTTKRTGTGLGLTIASRVIVAHGGRLTAAGAAGGGACFRVELPVTG